MIFILIPRCAPGGTQRRIRMILILILRCDRGPEAGSEIGMDFPGLLSLILIPRCARGRRQRKSTDFVKINDFVFDSALRPGGDTAQDHNHKSCDPATRCAAPQCWVRGVGTAQLRVAGRAAAALRREGRLGVDLQKKNSPGGSGG